ncbi:hypothetical protein L3X38_017605 [Prunus dulcis]|uniref:Uncharacterized protein n=1 Tax=Prunus dulcis TaxID=3755 RepID=A0AAD4ZAB1_PRUDU|nr:hypothetical protein L3X38_017605 [Prunus dulcis]
MRGKSVFLSCRGKSRRPTAREELLNLLYASSSGFEGVVGFGHVDQSRGVAGCSGGVHSGSKGAVAVMAAAEEDSLKGWGCGWVLGSVGWEMGGWLQVRLGSRF